jgi:hypothetical protein
LSLDRKSSWTAAASPNSPYRHCNYEHALFDTRTAPGL